MTETVRAFLALSPPRAWLEYIGALQSRLAQKMNRTALRGNRSVRWVNAENAHLTLLFLGEVAESGVTEITAAMQRAAASTQPFDLNAGGIGCFPSRGVPRVLWLGMDDSGALETLQKKLACELSPRREVLCPHADARSFQASGFSPHLTLARFKNLDSQLVRAIQETLTNYHVPPSPPWRVEKVQLLQSVLASHGPEYSLVASARIPDASP
jgi:2'-5' RNA ligase